MGFMKKWSFIIFIIIISSLVEESHSKCTLSDKGHKILHSGASLYIECICDKSTRSVQWRAPDGSVIEQRPGMYTARQDNTISLSIDNASTELDGQYKCVSVEADRRTHEVYYEITVFNSIDIDESKEQYLISGQDSLIHCSKKGFDDVQQVFWYKEEEFIFTPKSTKYEDKDEGLLVKNASKEDEGIYRCIMATKSYFDNIEVKITVKVHTPPKIESLTASPQGTVKEGDPLVLDCYASGDPMPTYSWRKIPDRNNCTPTRSAGLNITNEKILLTKPENLTLCVEDNDTNDENKTVSWEEEFGKLAFISVSMEDAGVYECQADNGLEIKAAKNITIEVLVAPKITEFQDATVEEGSTLSVICAAIGNSQPQIIVYGPESDDPPTYDEDKNISSRTIFNLTFTKVLLSHEGEYECSANNSVGNDSAKMYLKVLYKPFFQNPEEVIWTWGDAPVNLTCDFESEPPASVQWRFLGNADLANITDKITKDKIHYLRAKLKNETKDFFAIPSDINNFIGTYECVAKNNLGEANKIIHIKKGILPAQINSDQVNITDLTATSITFDIEDLVSNTTDAPPTLGYTAEYDEEENYNITDIHINRTWATKVPYKITRLEPMTEYRIRFAAVNKGGTGPYGEYLTFITPDKSVPEPPSLIQKHSGPILIPADNKILKLETPVHNGDPIDYYAIRYCQVEEPNECIEERVPPTTELKVDHLSPNTLYTVEMAAHNTIGNSTYVSLQLRLEEDPVEMALLSSEATIGIAAIVVILCILLLDVVLYITLKKGMIASCITKKNKNTDASKQSRDKKGLLKDKEKSAESLKRPDNAHKEFEYNKSTGVITGKHSAV